MKSSRPFVILVTAVAVLVLGFGAREQSGIIAGMAIADLAGVSWRLALVAIAGTLAYLMYHGQLIEVLRTVLVYVGLVTVLALGYTYRIEIAALAHKLLGESIPDIVQAGRDDAPRVEVKRGSGGDFSVPAELNGKRVRMIVDTGATAVVLTIDAARAAGLPLDFLRYDVPVETAGGRTKAASVVIEKLAVGGIVARKVPALVAEPGNNLKVSLLGMTFLSRLDSFEVRGDRMVMRGRPEGGDGFPKVVP